MDETGVKLCDNPECGRMISANKQYCLTCRAQHLQEFLKEKGEPAVSLEVAKRAILEQHFGGYDV